MKSNLATTLKTPAAAMPKVVKGKENACWYDSLTAAELAQLLAALGLPTSGASKGVQVARLRAHPTAESYAMEGRFGTVRSAARRARVPSSLAADPQQSSNPADRAPLPSPLRA